MKMAGVNRKTLYENTKDKELESDKIPMIRMKKLVEQILN